MDVPKIVVDLIVSTSWALFVGDKAHWPGATKVSFEKREPDSVQQLKHEDPSTLESQVAHVE